MKAQKFPTPAGDCLVWGGPGPEFLLIWMTAEPDPQQLDRMAEQLARGCGHSFALAAVPVRSWNDELSPWAASPALGDQGFGGQAPGTLAALEGQILPALKEGLGCCAPRVLLGGYSLAGLFALWASARSSEFFGVVAASPSVWFPGWMAFEEQHPIRARRVYLSLGTREEHTRNAALACVGDNIRALHQRLQQRGVRCVLEWNEGGHFRAPDQRTLRAFRWGMEE